MSKYDEIIENYLFNEKEREEKPFDKKVNQLLFPHSHFYALSRVEKALQSHVHETHLQYDRLVF